MAYDVKVETLTPRILAAVRSRVAIKDISTAFKPALDTVWAFLGRRPGLRSDGHNVFSTITRVRRSCQSILALR